MHAAIRTALSVNLNKVALLRNSRHLGLPSVVRAAQLCLQAGAAGITIHPRPDERHIRAADVADLAELLRVQWPAAEFNIEGNPTHNLMGFIEAVRPAQATFVPDAQDQFTSDHGWDVAADAAVLKPLIAQCQAWGVRVSLFMDANAAAMPSVRELGADRVELYTEPYAAAFDQAWVLHAHDLGALERAMQLAWAEPSAPAQAATAQAQALQALVAQLRQYAAAAAAAQAAGLAVNAGHDLNAHNLPLFLHYVPQVVEVSIGHAFMGDALEMGYARAVQLYVSSIARGCAGLDGGA